MTQGVLFEGVYTTPRITLEVARNQVQENRRTGVKCPCCDQMAREWRHSMVGVAVASLVRLVAMYEGEPIHLDQFYVNKKDRNFPTLKCWDLVEPGINEDTQKKASGMFYPTLRGIRFAAGEIHVPEYVWTYNKEVIGVEGRLVSVFDVLGNKFDYKELFNNE